MPTLRTLKTLRILSMRRTYSFWLLAIGFWLLTLSSCAQTKDTANSQKLTANSKNWCYPLPGAKVISAYGSRGGRGHSGTDIKTKANDNILAAFDGEVVFSGPYSGYGNLIRINGQSVNSARFFDHDRHQLRFDAFNKDGKIKSAKTGKQDKTKASKKTKKSKKNKKSKKSKKSKKTKKSKK